MLRYIFIGSFQISWPPRIRKYWWYRSVQWYIIRVGHWIGGAVQPFTFTQWFHSHRRPVVASISFGYKYKPQCEWKVFMSSLENCQIRIPRNEQNVWAFFFQPERCDCSSHLSLLNLLVISQQEIVLYCKFLTISISEGVTAENRRGSNPSQFIHFNWKNSQKKYILCSV